MTRVDDIISKIKRNQIELNNLIECLKFEVARDTNNILTKFVESELILYRDPETNKPVFLDYNVYHNLSSSANKLTEDQYNELIMTISGGLK